MPVKEEPELDDALVDDREDMEQPAEERGAHAMAPIEDHIDRELLETFSALAHLGISNLAGASVVGGGDDRARPLPGGGGHGVGYFLRLA